MIGSDEYNIINRNDTYYMLDAKCDSNVGLLSHHKNDCASFIICNDTDSSLFSVLNEFSLGNSSNNISENITMLAGSLVSQFLKQDETETEQNDGNNVIVPGIVTVLGVIGLSICGVYTVNKITTYIKTRYYNDVKHDISEESDLNDVNFIGEGTEL